MKQTTMPGLKYPVNEGSDYEFNRVMQEAMERGEYVHMMHPTKGLRYIPNTPAEIQAARSRGYSDVEYAEETVRVPIAKTRAKQTDMLEGAASTSKGKRG